MALKIAALADTHYAEGSLEACGKRRTAIADIILLRAVRELNRFTKPDLTIILGDLVDNKNENHQHLKEIIDLLESPVVIIPGNHDGDINDFYSIYPKPEDAFDINGVRVVTFIDPEEPGYNARRTDADLKRMDKARSDFDGPIVSLQHVPLFPPGASASPYAYKNAADVWAAFERNNFTLSISGHWHDGDDLIGRDAGRAVIVPALCESPFAFMEIIIDGDSVETHRHEFKMPSELELVDYHVHSPFAYCQQNMNMQMSIDLANEMGLAGLTLLDHSGQLYFNEKTFWGAFFMTEGIEYTEGIDVRMPAFLELAKQYCPPAYLGFEIDCDYSGNPVIRPDDLEHAQVRVGAIHWLAELRKPEPDIDLAGDEMLYRLSIFLKNRIHILAHPFRLFKKTPRLPKNMIPRLASVLRENGVAAEVSFHGQETSPEFVKGMVEAGVKLSFGSDSHNLYEVGKFNPHLKLMKQCGYTDSDLKEILIDVPKKQ